MKRTEALSDSRVPDSVRGLPASAETGHTAMVSLARRGIGARRHVARAWPNLLGLLGLFLLVLGILGLLVRILVSGTP